MWAGTEHPEGWERDKRKAHNFSDECIGKRSEQEITWEGYWNREH